MSENKSIADVYGQVDSIFGLYASSRKSSNTTLIVVSVVAVLASIIAIACCAVSYVSASRVTDMQRDVDALRSRVDVAEAYINNLNQRVK